MSVCFKFAMMGLMAAIYQDMLFCCYRFASLFFLFLFFLLCVSSLLSLSFRVIYLLHLLSALMLCRTFVSGQVVRSGMFLLLCESLCKSVM